jgi:hypothetical protein
MAKSRRRPRGRKTAPGVGDFISEQLVVLTNVALVLNGELYAHNARTTGRVAEHEAARAQAGVVVEATLGTAYPTVPPDAAAAFDKLASGQPVEYTSSRHFPEPWLLRPDHRTPITLWSRSAAGIMAAWLATYFRHPYRDRLRRCQQCAKWFVDMTRNKSALRCSKACTVAWSNKQRPTKGGR